MHVFPAHQTKENEHVCAYAELYQFPRIFPAFCRQSESDAKTASNIGEIEQIKQATRCQPQQYGDGLEDQKENERVLIFFHLVIFGAKVKVFSIDGQMKITIFVTDSKEDNMLQKGTKAPYFEGKDENGNLVKLTDFAGKKLVLYFYPKDSTPGCTAEACDLRDNYERFLSLGYHVLGVSRDSAASHQRFIAKFNLPFHLIADTDLTILKAYEAWGEKKMYGKMTEGTLRTTYIIDEEGVIIDAIGKVDTKNHTAQIL